MHIIQEVYRIVKLSRVGCPAAVGCPDVRSPLSNSPATPPARRMPIDGSLAVLIGLVIALLAVLLWAASLRGDLDSANQARDLARAEVEQLRSQSNATHYQLEPSINAPPNANGTAFIALDGAGMIMVANLDPAPAGQAYQVWYTSTVDAEPNPGATFPIDDAGFGFMLIPADAGLFTQISITLEPEGGSESPTGPVILTGATSGARG